jgi:hypothetical protein
MNARFFDFAKQNQKNGHSFKMFVGGVSRQESFETASFQECACKSKPYCFEGIQEKSLFDPSVTPSQQV